MSKNNEKSARRKSDKNNPLRRIIEKILSRPYLLILGLTIAVYFQTLFFGYVLYDDHHFKMDNDPKKIEQLTSIKAALDNSYMYSSYYRPIINFSFLIDAQLAGDSALMHHFTNLVCHCAACCILFALFRSLGYKKIIALITTVLFAVHPLFTNAVVWIVGRNDLLVAIFSFSSFIFLFRYFEKGKTSSLILHGLTLMIAVFTKELALLIPIVSAAYWIIFVPDKKFDGKTGLMLFYWILPYIFFPMAKYLLNIPMTDPYFHLSNILVNYRVVLEVVAKLIVPVKMSTMPSFNIFSTILGAIILTGAVVMIVIRRKNIDMKRIAFGALWFFIFFGPGLFVRVIKAGQMQDYLECRVYLPIIGVIIVVLELLPVRVWDLTKKLNFYIVALLVIILSTLTINQSRYYIDKNTFREDAANMNPDILQQFVDVSPIVADSLVKEGLAKGEAGDFKGAVEDLSRAIIIDSSNFRYFVKRGLFREKLKNLKEAAQDFDRVLDLKPKYPPALYKRATLKIEMYDYQGAVADFDEYLDLKPGDVPALYLRGSAKIDLFDYQGAVEDFNELLKKKTDDHLALIQRGTAKFFLEDYNAAISDFSEALRLSPESPDIYLNRGRVYHKIGKMKLACADFSKAKSLGNQQAEQMLKNYCQ